MVPPAEAEDPDIVRAVSWNIAAINANPFEYWITYVDPTYNDLMYSVENFVTNPKNDTQIMNVFTNDMFYQLKGILEKQGINGLVELEGIWRRDFSKRMAIKEFLKDASIGDKRLASMPDRVTNTIILSDGKKLLRPTPINAYPESLRSIDEWWEKWKLFMFETPVDLYSGGGGGGCNGRSSVQYVVNLIEPICRSKYPAITTAEQDISVALQLLCLAILDAIFLHILNSVAPGTWEKIRREICEALIEGKESGVCRILRESYLDAHVIFLQEAAAILIERIRADPALHSRSSLVPIIHLC